MTSIFTALGRFSVKFRYLVVVFWILITVAAVQFFPSISSVSKSNNSDFLPANSPSNVAANLASPVVASGVFPVPVVVVSTNGPISSNDAFFIKDLTTIFKNVPKVKDVVDSGISTDGQADQLLVLTTMSAGANGTDTVNFINSLNNDIKVVHLPPHLKAYVTGNIAIQVANQTQSNSTGNAIQSFSVLFILILLLIIFRSVLAPIVTVMPALFVVTLSGPVIAEVSKIGMQVSEISQLMLIVLILGAGTDYGLFLVFREREEMRNGLAPKDAIIKALGRVGESISFSAFTVIAALLSLLASTFGLYKSLGGPLAIGIFLMLLAGLTLLPALLAIFGRAVFWPSKNKEGMNKAGLWGKVAARIVKRPAITLGVGVTIFALLAVASFGNKPAGFGGSTTAPKGSNAAIGAALIEQHFPHSSSNPTTVVMKFERSIWVDPSLIVNASSRLASSPVFTSVEGPLNPLGINLSPSRYVSLHKILGNPKLLPPVKPTQLINISNVDYLNYRATGQFVSSDGLTVLFETSLSAGDPSTTQALNAVPQIRDAVSSAASAVGAVASGVTGEAPALYDISTSSNRDLVHVIPLAVLVIGFLLMLVMRSLVAPIYLIASVALSYMAALGLSVIVFIYILGDGGLTFILPFLMFLFLLALGEDYNILVMTRIREEAHELPLREAVAKAISTTGTTVTSAGLVLAGTFAVFAIAGASTGTTEIRDVGFGLALGVLMDTFLVRTLLVPSTVVLLGKLNWWPSKLAQIEHGELSQQ